MYRFGVIHLERTRAASRLVAALAALWFLFAVAQPAYSHEGDSYLIEMTDSGFVPDRLEIIAGDVVVFQNVGDQDHWPATNSHPTHRIYSDFDPQKPIIPGASWSFIFFRPGVWGFHDHQFPDFTGQITVLPDTHPLPQGQDPAAASTGSSERGLSRIFSAIERYISTIVGAARQLVADVFGSGEGVAAVDPAPFIQPELETDFQPPPEASFDQVYRDLQLDCPTEEFDCWASFFRRQTISFGPTIAVDLLLQLRDDGAVDLTVDEHQLGHQIGRQTAESFGVNDESFLLCPMSQLNGGCQHGFFEYVLGRANSTTDAANLICEQLQEGYATKDYFYCYHGVGHGVMMAAAYDLDRALDVCDSLGDPFATDGCWQGVFMENVNAGMGGFAVEGVFSEEDPLAPCSLLEDQYKHECYVNHAGWLMDFFKYDVEAAAAACMDASDGYQNSCLESIGLMVTNPVWQDSLYGDLGDASFEEVAWELCTRFPPDRISSCVVGGIDNIHNFDIFSLDRATAFCNIVSVDLREMCYRRMGFNLFNQALEPGDVLASCNSLEPDDREACLSGAGVDL